MSIIRNSSSKLFFTMFVRYGSDHMENCRSCSVAYKALNVKDVLKVASIALIGIVAAVKQDAVLAVARTILVSLVVILYALSIWFNSNDDNHAFR